MAPDDGESFAGLLPEAEQRKIKEAKGDLIKGQIWEQMVAEGKQ
jgi:hypothetical protein